MWARMLNILVGTWLLVSAFALAPNAGLAAWTLVLALGAILFEALAFWRRPARYGTTVVGALLIATAFLGMFSGPALAGARDLWFWNQFLCGVALVVLSLAFGTRMKAGSWMPGGGTRTSSTATGGPEDRHRLNA